MDDILYTAGGYVVHLSLVNDPMLQESTQVYGVFNKSTGVREAETRRFINAKLFCDQFKEEDEAYEANKLQLELWPAVDGSIQ